jgi:hypothetical protein
MTEKHVPAEDLGRLRPGDRLEAHRDGMVRHRGVVEETVPALGVVWIRERGTGARKMLATDDFQFRCDRHAHAHALADRQERP